MEKKNFENGTGASMSAKTTNENMQWTKYHNQKGGHGFAAEDANLMAERIYGHKAKNVGYNNAKDGADLILDGVPHQVKFCCSASRTIDACFDANGIFRYTNIKILVPKDQYNEAVEIFKRKIAEGKVPGITNPQDAMSIVKKGNITYEQSQRIRRAGTKESVSFDALTQAQVAGMIGGLAAGITFVTALVEGKSIAQAWDEAKKSFAKAGLTTLVGGVLTQQVLRTTVGRNAAAATTRVVKNGVDNIMKTSVGKRVVGKIAEGVSGKAIKGVAARNAVTKAVRVNVITSAIMFAVDSVPDTIKLCRGKISAKEYGKSRAVGASGVAGGSAGYLAGMAIGTAICPGVGTAVGGFLGGIGGGMGASSLMNKIVSLI